ncbi:MAG: class IV adenylate cyclase [Nanoarchaeota archaeon]
MVEVEIRFRTFEKIEDTLNEIGAKLISEDNESDVYFKFKEDRDRRFIIRIRNINDKTILTFKGSSLLEKDSAWLEWENEIADSEVLKKLLLSNGFVELVTIKKNRKKFIFQDFEINYDEVENLGSFVEIELQGDDPAQLRDRVMDFAIDKLKIPKKDLIEKGYVKLMLNE